MGFLWSLSFLSHDLFPIDGTGVSLFICPPKELRGEEILRTLTYRF